MKITKSKNIEKKFELDLKQMSKEEICERFKFEYIWGFYNWFARFMRQGWSKW